MKNTLLLPHRWRIAGWALTLPALAAGIYLMTLDGMDYLKVTLPGWLAQFLWAENFVDHSSNGQLQLYILDEIVTFSLLIGLSLLGFSKEKIEDEWVQKVRLDSLQWAILVNTALLLAFTLLVHGLSFLGVMIYNMFTPLLIFVGRYYYVLHLKPLFSKS
jgi:hypothetical protein